jgi:N-acetylmuramoyl-L-alanine amidase
MSIEYVVKQGDCLSSISARFGFSSYRAVYDAPENAEFKRKRPNPNLIYPGDVLVIPDKEAKEIEVASGARYRFKLAVKPTWLRLEIKVDDPHRYLLEVGEASFRGKTDGTAPIEHQVDPLEHDGTIRLWPDGDDAPDEPPDDAIRWSLQLGGLDPVDEVSGVQGRLSNLGYYDGPINGTVDDLTTAAIRWFQRDQGEDETGTIDDALRRKLSEAHDGA